jgi:putative membrane protein (TIGR04086 family)
MGVLAFFILGFLAGNTAQKNGLLEGLIAASIIILITLVINFFVQVPFIARSFIKTVAYLSAAALGGILGVNFKPLIGRNSA